MLCEERVLSEPVAEDLRCEVFLDAEGVNAAANGFE